MYRKKLILNYHIKDGYGAKNIIKVMKQKGEKPASRGVIRRLINTYDRILSTAESISKCKFTKSFCKRLHLE